MNLFGHLPFEKGEGRGGVSLSQACILNLPSSSREAAEKVKNRELRE